LARGLMVGLGAAAKFAPLAAAPLLASPDGRRRGRPLLHYGCALAAAVAVPIALYMGPGGLSAFWSCTLGYQLHRISPLSVWTLHPGIDWLKPLVYAAIAALVVAASFLPRRRTLAQVAALTGAILAAVQVPAANWFYFYAVWFAPFALIAMFAAYRTDSGDTDELAELNLRVPDPEPLYARET
jgi:hypothetical protein